MSTMPKNKEILKTLTEYEQVLKKFETTVQKRELNKMLAFRLRTFNKKRLNKGYPNENKSDNATEQVPPQDKKFHSS